MDAYRKAPYPIRPFDLFWRKITPQNKSDHISTIFTEPWSLSYCNECMLNARAFITVKVRAKFFENIIGVSVWARTLGINKIILDPFDRHKQTGFPNSNDSDALRQRLSAFVKQFLRHSFAVWRFRWRVLKSLALPCFRR
ncbi:MAG: hypothetical protein CL680_07085 [Blastomonas sp.]|nr:hypothetical protein [Blastomonas sp.]